MRHRLTPTPGVRDARGRPAIRALILTPTRELAAQVIDWLSALSERGATVLIGDPGRSYLPKDRLSEVATYQVPVTRALEDAEIKKSSVWRLAREER